MAPFSKLQQRPLQRRRRKESLQKLLHLSTSFSGLWEKPWERGCSPFASKAKAVTSSLFPYYTPVFFLFFYCK